MLYFDTSKLDFGNLSVSDFKKPRGSIEPQNLLSLANLKDSPLNPNLAATVYALGRVNMILHSGDGKNVSIYNDYNQLSNRATDYDWNTGGSMLRNGLIRAERKRAGLNDIHGFRTFYYGVGGLNN